jgi:hypothetical protein
MIKFSYLIKRRPFFADRACTISKDYELVSNEIHIERLVKYGLHASNVALISKSAEVVGLTNWITRLMFIDSLFVYLLIKDR